MRVKDQGFVIAIRNYGENSILLKVFCREKGICRGFINGANSQKMRTIIQLGNLISFEIFYRNDDALGSFSRLDIVESFCGKILFDQLRLSCALSALAMIDEFFLEHVQFQDLFAKLHKFFNELTNPIHADEEIIADYIRFELLILKVLGYEIDLSSCVATGCSQNLSYVSPKSARAVSYEAGKIYAHKMLILPQFLVNDKAQIGILDLYDAMKLSEYFVQKFLLIDQLNLSQKKFYYRTQILEKIASKMSNASKS